jgi:replicative DNA helicase
MSDATEIILIEAEQAVLGSCILDEKALREARTILRGCDWVRPTHSKIWRSIGALVDREQPVDVISLQNELNICSEADDQIAVEYLISCVESVPTAANVAYYAGIVRNHAILRKQGKLGREIYQMTQEHNADPQAVQNHIVLAVQDMLTDQDIGLEHVRDIANRHYSSLSDKSERDDHRLIATGLPLWDGCSEPLGETQYIILKGFRGSGKTHVMIDMAARVAHHGRGVALYSLEMSKPAILNRLHASVTGVNSRILRHPKSIDVWEHIANANATLDAQEIFIDDRAGITISEISAQCEALKLRGVDLAFVGIDYSEYIGVDKHREREQLELKEISIGCKRLSTALECTVMLISQVNQNGSTRGAMDFENGADLLLHWRCEPKSDIGALEACKNKGGESWTQDCKIDKGTSRISAITVDRQADEESMYWAK